MVRCLAIASAVMLAVMGASGWVSAAQAQYLGPPEEQQRLPPGALQEQPGAETPELKPPTSPIITVRNRASLSACRKIGGVRAVAPVAGQTGLPAYDLVLVEMKEKTVDAGGTHLLLIATISGTNEAKGVGEAYVCDPGRGPAAVVPKH